MVENAQKTAALRIVFLIEMQDNRVMKQSFKLNWWRRFKIWWWKHKLPEGTYVIYKRSEDAYLAYCHTTGSVIWIPTRRDAEKFNSKAILLIDLEQMLSVHYDVMPMLVGLAPKTVECMRCGATMPDAGSLYCNACLKEMP